MNPVSLLYIQNVLLCKLQALNWMYSYYSYGMGNSFIGKLAAVPCAEGSWVFLLRRIQNALEQVAISTRQVSLMAPINFRYMQMFVTQSKRIGCRRWAWIFNNALKIVCAKYVHNKKILWKTFYCNVHGLLEEKFSM